MLQSDVLDILESLFGTLVIPSAVEHEVEPQRSISPHGSYSAGRLYHQAIHSNQMLRDALTINLDPGEAEAITLALEHNAELLLLDEIAGGRLHLYHCVHRSIGCLVEAKRMGIIHSIKPLLDAMKEEARFWINPRLYSRLYANTGNKHSELESTRMGNCTFSPDGIEWVRCNVTKLSHPWWSTM